MPDITHDATDRAIAQRLQQDGRLANVDLADAVRLSPSACLRRTKSLEAEGVIVGYRAELDRSRLGLNLTAFVSLRVNQHSREMSRHIESALLAIPAVVACHVVSGQADFLVELVVRDLAAYERVLLDDILGIEGMADARTMFAIRSALNRGPLPVDGLA